MQSPWIYNGHTPLRAIASEMNTMIQRLFRQPLFRTALFSVFLLLVLYPFLLGAGDALAVRLQVYYYTVLGALVLVLFFLHRFGTHEGACEQPDLHERDDV